MQETMKHILDQNVTSSLSRLCQERPQLQDALFFNPDGLLIVLLNISSHFSWKKGREEIIFKDTH